MIRSKIITICITLVALVSCANSRVFADGHDIAREVTIEESPATQEQLIATFEQMLSGENLDDIEALMKVAKWASSNGLSSRANQIYTRVLAIDIDHIDARRALRFVSIAGKWHHFDEMMGLLSRRIASGWGRRVQDNLFRELLEIASNTKEKLAVGEMYARAQLSAGQLAKALKNFELQSQLAKDASLEEPFATMLAFRYRTIVSILQANPDGVYVLTEAYPAKSVLLGSEEPHLLPGPVWIGQGMALDAALRDCAMKQISEGSELVVQARMNDSLGSEKAEDVLDQAEGAFLLAESLIPGISRPRRVDVARLRIKAIRQRTDAQVKLYDQSESNLGTKLLAARDYYFMLDAMIGQLDDIVADIELIVDTAMPFSGELSGELRWAKTDLKTIRMKRSILQEELYDR